jgi:hypothetical protein
MTRNQLHGKTFEDFIKACGLFPGSADGGRSVTASFDIEAKFDKQRGLPTSIKSTGSDTVGLSDARRFWQIDEAYRMIVGRYQQEDGVKVFDQAHEFLLDPLILAELRGDISYEEVKVFHHGLSLDAFPKGSHEEARVWAQAQKEVYVGRGNAIILNPKIDSKKQRRLQCSVSLTTLIERCSENERYILHTDWIGDVRLPIELSSGVREFGT